MKRRDVVFTTRQGKIEVVMSQKIQQHSQQKTAQWLETGNGGEPYNNASLHADNHVSPRTDESCFAGAAGLAVIPGQLVAYFSGRANVDDMDVPGFSLHHLFCRIDMLYRAILPDVLNGSTPAEKPERSSKFDSIAEPLQALIEFFALGTQTN